MQLFIDIYGFLSVLLRGSILTAQSLTIGGVAFLLALALPLAPALAQTKDRIFSRLMRLLFWSAACLVGLEALNIASLSVLLVGAMNLSVKEALGAEVVISDLLVLAPAAVIAFESHRPRTAYSGQQYLLAAMALALLCAQVSTTHSASRLGSPASLMAAEYLHMLGAAIWIGGIPYFLVSLSQTQDGATWRLIGRRFSLMSICAVGMIAFGGAAMSVSYIGSFEAAYGAAYGVMVLAKLALFIGLLILGGMNFSTIERLRRGATASILRLMRFAEAEIGVGLTVLFAAASLTSLPPAIDLAKDRVSWSEIVERVTPRWPIRLESPDHAALSIAQLDKQIEAARVGGTAPPKAYVPGEGLAAPRNAEDIAWSEYNHHWAGLFVALCGLLALCEHSRFLAPLARHWPLLFLGLAAFLFLRADEGVWPLGKLGLFESLRDPEIAQHRLFVALIVAFGVFEWRVRLGRINIAWAPLVFPLVTAAGGALLLAHSHGLANIKDEFLIEITHTPLALLGVAAAWARWLEIRLVDRASRVAGWIWPTAFMAAGLLLLTYREA
jgi:putative copper resistance protein D